MNEQNTKTQENSAPKKKLLRLKFPRISKKLLLTIPLIILIAAGVYFGKGLLVAALVNGTPVTRYSVISSLEKSQGQSALDNLVTESLIKQEIKKANVTVTPAEVDAEIAKIEAQVAAQGSTLDAALAEQNMTRKKLLNR
jgi:foldase protein PrsA